MAQIQSSRSVAQGHATAFTQYSQALSDVAKAAEDEMTTVAGNTNARNLIRLSEQAADQVAQSVLDMVANVHSVVNEFEALDQSVATRFPGSGGM